MNDCILQPDLNAPRPHVLVVDDESHVRSLLVRWLTDAGCTCSEARDLEEAFEQLRRQPIDVLTLDLRMPHGSGLDAVHGIVREFPDTAIVIVAADNDTQDAIAALTSGACDYLVKPIDRDVFLWRMRRALAARQRGQAARPSPSPPVGPRPVFLARPYGELAHREDRETAGAVTCGAEDE